MFGAGSFRERWESKDKDLIIPILEREMLVVGKSVTLYLMSSKQSPNPCPGGATGVVLQDPHLEPNA